MLRSPGVRNSEQGGTCFKSELPTLIDVIITDSKLRISSVLNVDVGLSDFHHLVCAATKLNAPMINRATFQYRSFKHFNEELFQHDVSQIPFHISEIFDDVNDCQWVVNALYADVVNDHAPLKIARKRRNHAPFMNTQLRKARNVKAMLWRRYISCRTPHTWDKYRR